MNARTLWHKIVVLLSGVGGGAADETLDDPPPRCSQDPLVVRTKDGSPKDADGALSGGLLGVSRSMEHEFLSILSYRRFLLSMKRPW